LVILGGVNSLTLGLPSPARGSRRWLGLVALGLLTFASAWLAFRWLRFGGVAALWVSNGLLTGALLLRPRREWPAWFAAGLLGPMAARAMVGDTLLQSLYLPLVNLLECFIVAAWVRRHNEDLAAAPSLRAVAKDASASTLVACLISASLALPVLLTRAGATPLEAWATWFSAHLLGMVVMATLTVCAFQQGAQLFGERGRRVDFAGCLALLLLCCWAAFGQTQYSFLFLVYLPWVLLAWRHGLGGMVIGTIVVAAISGITATNGLGAFALSPADSPLAHLFYWQLYIAAGCVLSYSTAIAITHRRQLQARLERSESRYRLLAENSQDLIVRRLADGRRAYVSPSSLSMLGYKPEELPNIDELLHPDDHARVTHVFGKLFTGGDSQGTLRYRVRHRDGHWIWLEANAQRLELADGPQVVYTARDITQRVLAEQGQVALQAQLQAITDHLPAMVARFDRDARYLYANERSRAMVPGIDLIGKTLPELRGPEHYAQFRPMVEAVLKGETQAFDTWLDTPQGRIELRAQFVPDRAADGSVQGFYSLAFDITEDKRLERELERLARFDALTGLANRRHFEEKLAEQVALARRTGQPLLLLALDLDRFKQINDTLGHAAGDEVLVEFGRRVAAAAYADVDLVARLGGDEFMVLVEYSANAEAGERMARKIIDAMAAPIALASGQKVLAATSIGIGLAQPVQSGEALLELADKALYEAKAQGRNTFALRTG